MIRIRQKTIELLGEQVRLAIPLYPDVPVGVEYLPAKPINSYRGIATFNHILIHFGQLINDFLYTDRRQNDISLTTPKNVKEIEQLSKKLTDLVKNIENSRYSKDILVQNAVEYRSHLYKIARLLRVTTKEKITEFPYTFVPLRGGAHVVSSLQVPLNSMIAIDCKRIPLEDGTFAFGMDSPVFDPYDIDRIAGQKLRIVEVCIASGITSAGIMLDFYAKGCLPKELVFQVLFASKVGLSFVQAIANELKIKIRFYVAKVYDGVGDLRMTGDSIVNERQEKVIGDASTILEFVKNRESK